MTARRAAGAVGDTAHDVAGTGVGMFDVDAYYRLVVARFPEVAGPAAAIRRDAGDDLYPLLWHLLGPLLRNVGMHGARSRRREVFDCVDDLLVRHPEVANEVGAGVVEVLPDGWYETARENAGPRLRDLLDGWEPGWTARQGPRRRGSDLYGVEDALKNTPQAAGPTGNGE